MCSDFPLTNSSQLKGGSSGVLEISVERKCYQVCQVLESVTEKTDFFYFSVKKMKL